MSAMQTPTNRNRNRMFLVGAAIVAVVIGALGYRTLVASISQGQVDAQLTPEPPQVFQGNDLTLTYPGAWKVLDMSQQDVCKQRGVECLIQIGSPSDGTNINLVRFTLDQEASVEEVDQALWAQFESGAPDVALESREAMEVGGQPAVRRIFNMPSQQVPSERAHLLQIFIVKELSLYQFTVFAPSADALTQHLAEIEEITKSLQFTP